MRILQNQQSNQWEYRQTFYQTKLKQKENNQKLKKKMKISAGFLGLALADSGVKIIGGSVPAAGSEPYIVSLQRSGSHFCGGSIISSCESPAD